MDSNDQPCGRRRGGESLSGREDLADPLDQGVTYSTYLYQVRGHVFHFGARAKKNDAQSADDPDDIELPLLRAGLER